MSKRRCANWLDTYMQYSSSSESPDNFHFWTAVSCIAGALRRRVWIDMGYFEWTPNFYIVFVAPPGIVSKSTTASIGMNLLRQVPSIKFGPDAVTWQSLVQSLADSTEGVELNGEISPMSAITIVSSEFGTFLDPNNREMVDVLVSLWDGQRGAFQKSTKTQGNDNVENPWVNILACTTPAWIAGNFPEYMIGGGFTSRTVFVYGEDKRHLVAYPGALLPPEHHRRAEDLIHDLEIISTELVGPYIITEEARAWGEVWYERHYATTPTHLMDDKFGGYRARKQSHIHKLALIIAAAQRNELTITMEDLIAAEGFMTETETHMPKVFAQIASEESRFANELKGILFRIGACTIRDAYLPLQNSCSSRTFNEALDSLRLAGYVHVTGQNIRPTKRLYDSFNITLDEKPNAEVDAAVSGD